MADDINIVISVDDRDVIRARKHQNKLQAAVAQLEKEFRKQNITAGKRLSELNKQSSALAKLGGSYDKAKSEVFRYAASLRKATDAQVAQAQATVMAKNKTNKFGMVSQQVGYQVGDFFVQVQSGTSALVAFGQQGTQLAGLLPGVAGAIIGIGLAIGTMVLRTRQQMNESETGLKAYSEAMKSLKEETKELIAENKRLAGGFVTVEQMFIEARKNALREEIKLLQANIKLREDINNNAISTGWWARLKESVSSIDFKKIFKGYKELQEQMDRPLEVLAMETSILEKEKQLGKITEDQSKNEKAKAENVILQNNRLKHSYQDLANSRLKSNKDVDEKITEESERLAKITFDRAMAFSKAYDNALYGAERKSRVKNYVDYLKLMSKEVKNNFDVISGQEYVNKPPKQQEYISNFDAIMAQELVDQERLKQSRIKFAKDMEILAQQLAFKGGMEQMAKGYDPREELFEKLNVEVQDRIKLLEVELDYGQDSLELEKAILQQERWRKIEAAREAKLSEGMIHLLDMEWTREMNLLLLARKQREEKEKLLELEEQRLDFEKKIEGSLESGFMSMIDGTKSVTDAFRSMARDVIKELYRILVVQQIVNQAKTAIQSLSGHVFPSASSSLPNYSPPTVNANGNAFNNGKIIPYANGGVVGSPTMFPMSGGNTGLMGEAGPEAILPLKRGPDGKLGVESSGGSVVVNQTINVSTGVVQTVRNEIKTLMPQIAEGAKSAVLDAKRRGGSFGSAFA